ncbi:pyruvate kinase, partial [Patescibacteria group bacterium]|nr:pyruvate kinase [Patescibacteria group bacterium]
MSTKLTKIVATLGPATDSPETIKELIQLGVNVFRFNTKHSTTEWHEERIKRVQDVADGLGQSIGILLDLQGPEIRIETKDKENVFLKKDEVVRVGVSFAKKVTKLVIPHIAVIKVLKKDDLILINDGDVVLEVVSTKRKYVLARAVNECEISNRKGVNIPGKKNNLPSLVEADLKQLDMASMNKVDFIALSFARNRNDVIFLKREMEKRKVNAQIVVKIENQQALDNLDELIEESDAVMIARGDLGV